MNRERRSLSAATTNNSGGGGRHFRQARSVSAHVKSFPGKRKLPSRSRTRRPPVAKYSSTTSSDEDADDDDDHDSDDASEGEVAPPVPASKPRTTRSANRQAAAASSSTDDVCHMCGKLFGGVAELERHLEVHSEQHPFQCPLCDKSFKYKKGIERHIIFDHKSPDAPSSRKTLANAPPPSTKKPLLNVPFIKDEPKPTPARDDSLDDPPSASARKRKHFKLESEVEKNRELYPTLTTSTTQAASSAVAAGPTVQKEADKLLPTAHAGEAPKRKKKDKSRKRPLKNVEAKKDAETDSKRLIVNAVVGASESDPPTPDQPTKDVEYKELRLRMQVLRRTCPYCGKLCLKPSDLHRHTMKHTGEQPFECQQCKRRFKAKRSMQYHLRSVHGATVELSPALEGKFFNTKKYRRRYLCEGKRSTSAIEQNPEVSSSNSSVSGARTSAKSEQQASPNFTKAEASGAEPEFAMQLSPGPAIVPNDAPPSSDGAERKAAERTSRAATATKSKPKCPKKEISKPEPTAPREIYDFSDEDDLPLVLKAGPSAFCLRASLPACGPKDNFLPATESEVVAPSVMALEVTCVPVVEAIIPSCDSCVEFPLVATKDTCEESAQENRPALPPPIENCPPFENDHNEPVRTATDQPAGMDCQDSPHVPVPIVENSSPALGVIQLAPPPMETVKSLPVFGIRLSEEEDEGASDGESRVYNIASFKDPSGRSASGTVEYRVQPHTAEVLITRMVGVNLVDGEKRFLYKCHWCCKVFLSLTKLQGHLSVHLRKTQKTYSCSSCGQTFQQKSLRKLHCCTDKIPEPSPSQVVVPPPSSEPCFPESSLAEHATSVIVSSYQAAEEPDVLAGATEECIKMDTTATEITLEVKSNIYDARKEQEVRERAKRDAAETNLGAKMEQNVIEANFDAGTEQDVREVSCGARTEQETGEADLETTIAQKVRVDASAENTERQDHQLHFCNSNLMPLENPPTTVPFSSPLSISVCDDHQDRSGQSDDAGSGGESSSFQSPPVEETSPVNSALQVSEDGSRVGYRCHFCSKMFDRLFSLHRHERIHTGVKPCFCTECGRGFSEPRNLRHHVIRFHSDGSQRHLLRRERHAAAAAAAAAASAASSAGTSTGSGTVNSDSGISGGRLDPLSSSSSSTHSPVSSPAEKRISFLKKSAIRILNSVSSSSPPPPFHSARSSSSPSPSFSPCSSGLASGTEQPHFGEQEPHPPPPPPPSGSGDSGVGLRAEEPSPGGAGEAQTTAAELEESLGGEEDRVTVIYPTEVPDDDAPRMSDDSKDCGEFHVTPDELTGRREILSDPKRSLMGNLRKQQFRSSLTRAVNLVLSKNGKKKGGAAISPLPNSFESQLPAVTSPPTACLTATPTESRSLLSKRPSLLADDPGSHPLAESPPPPLLPLTAATRRCVRSPGHRAAIVICARPSTPLPSSTNPPSTQRLSPLPASTASSITATNVAESNNGADSLDSSCEALSVDAASSDGAPRDLCSWKLMTDVSSVIAPISPEQQGSEESIAKDETKKRKKGNNSYFSTYSPRLNVVNKPVSRSDACKPQILPDGRMVFTCFYCHKTFPSASDVNRHMDFHEDVRPYKCNFCDYLSRTNSQLKVHMMRHQGIKQYLCEICHYYGVTQSDLNRHKKTQAHCLRARNVCQLCGLGYFTRQQKVTHMLTVHLGLTVPPDANGNVADSEPNGDVEHGLAEAVAAEEEDEELRRRLLRQEALITAATQGNAIDLSVAAAAIAEENFFGRGADASSFAKSSSCEDDFVQTSGEEDGDGPVDFSCSAVLKNNCAINGKVTPGRSFIANTRVTGLSVGCKAVENVVNGGVGLVVPPAHQQQRTPSCFRVSITKENYNCALITNNAEKEDPITVAASAAVLTGVGGATPGLVDGNGLPTSSSRTPDNGHRKTKRNHVSPASSFLGYWPQSAVTAAHSGLSLGRAYSVEDGR